MQLDVRVLKYFDDCVWMLRWLGDTWYVYLGGSILKCLYAHIRVCSHVQLIVTPSKEFFLKPFFIFTCAHTWMLYIYIYIYMLRGWCAHMHGFLHAWMVTCSLPYMPWWSHAPMHTCFKHHMLTCYDDPMLPFSYALMIACYNAHMLDIHTHTHTLRRWSVYML